MKITKIIKRLAVTSGAFAVMDALWLGVIMKDFYSEHLGDLARRNGQGLDPDWTAALLVYAVLITGVNFFAVDNGPRTGRVLRSLSKGALFGFISYGVYDLTNKAVHRDWSWEMTAIDMAWGAFMCAVVAAVASASD